MQKQHQILKQKFKLSPQQIQFLGLLAIPLVDLEKRIEEELEENPTLEESDATDSTDNKEENFHYKNKDSKQDFIVDNLTGNINSLSNFLHKQLIGINNSDKEVELLEYLIDSLDDNGFLTQRKDAIIDDYFIANDILISFLNLRQYNLKDDQVKIYDTKIHLLNYVISQKLVHQKHQSFSKPFLSQYYRILEIY